MIELIAFGGTFAAGVCCGCWLFGTVHLRLTRIECNSVEPPISNIDEPRLSGLERYWLEKGIEA